MTREERNALAGNLGADIAKIGELTAGLMRDRTILLAALRQIRELAGEDVKGDMRFARIVVAADAALRQCQHG